MDHDWMLDEVATGLQKLVCLSLDRTPAAEVLVGTAKAWLESLTEDRDWQEARDAERIRKAFVTLARVSRRWPSVPEFTDALPPIPPAPAIGYEVKPASPQAVREHVERIRAMLGNVAQPMPPAKVEREITPEQRERIEAELVQHYDRKRAAGGDA